MYRALYAFDNTAENVLPCEAGDRFTILDDTDEHWWLAQNGRGQVGYIPASYLAVDEVNFQFLFDASC
jgi:SH3 domain